MAWYSDEQYAMIQDCRDKKHTAASAFKQRTHCGKGGGVKLPSDYRTAKEIRAMNGECVSYRMGDPITWDEFKTWPEEHQKTYILNVREKFKVPGTALAKAMGTEEHRLRQYIKCLGLSQGKEAGGAGKWWHDTDDATRFWAWWNGEEIPEYTTPNLREPMTWHQFKSLTQEQKTEYIVWIRDIFSAPDRHIAETLFRISPITLHKEFTVLGLCLGKNGSSSKKVWNKESFIAWCNKNKKSPEEGPVTKVEPTINVEELFAMYANTEEAANEEITGIEEAKDTTEPTVEEETMVEEAIIDNPDGILDIPEAPVTLEKTCTPETCELAGDCEKKRIYDAGPIAFAGNSIPIIPKSGSMTFENNRAEDILTTLKTLLGNTRVNLTVTWDCKFE
mgnify:CR=1 FL=1